MIKSLAHACFVVSDLEVAEDFYVRILGLRHAFDFLKESGERFGVYLYVGERTFIELFIGEPHPVEGGSYQHICFEVDDVRKAVLAIREAGGEITDAVLGSDESWQAWITDPNGNRIELHSYTPGSLQKPFI